MTTDWPGGVDPVVDQVQVAYIERDGRPIALLRLVDELGEHRDIEVSERASWAAMVGFTHFLRQTCRGGTRCADCNRPREEHPQPECPTWR